MPLFTYINYADPVDRNCFKATYPKLIEAKELFPIVQIEAEFILQADEAYETLTTISPSRFMRHTPPILVSFE